MIKCSTKAEGEKDVYWPKQQMNDVITDYKFAENTETRSDIYNTHIHSSLEKMNEIWARKILGRNASDDVITDGLSFAARTLDKFNAEYGDAFGFLSVSLKRYYQQIGISYQKYISQHLSIEELGTTKDGDTIEIDLKPMYEPSFRDDFKLNLLTEFLSDERNYQSICRKFGYRAGSIPIRRLKHLYQLLKLNDDTLLNKDNFANLLHEISPVFLNWLDNRPEGPPVPVVITPKAQLIQCKCLKCGTVVIKPPTQAKGNLNVICEECRYKKKMAYKPPVHAFNCTSCHTAVYRRDKPRNGIIHCPDCKEKLRLDKGNESRKVTTNTCTLKNRLHEQEPNQKKSTHIISVESVSQLNNNSHRIIQCFLNNELHGLSVHSSSITFSEKTEQLIRFFRGISDLPVENGTYLSYRCNITEAIARDHTDVGSPNCTKIKRETTVRKVVRPEGYIPKSKQKLQLTCPKCGKSREVGYSLYIKTKDKPTMCRQCWASDKEYIAKKTAKAMNTKHVNNVRQGFVRKEDQKYKLTCPKCGKVREVSYSYYLLKRDDPSLCQTCCNGDPDLLKRKISKRLKTIEQKHNNPR